MMKNAVRPFTSLPHRPRPLSGRLGGFVSASALCGGLLLSTQAAVITKSDTNALASPVDWIGGAVPGPLDIASFTLAVSAANLASLSLGSNAAWQGLTLGPSNGPMVIQPGSVLTLGSAGINLSAATKNLTLNCGLTLQGAQSWSAAAGRTLTIGGTFSHLGARVDFTNFNTSATLLGISNDASGILGAWATTGAGTTLNYVKNTGGSLAPFTGQTATGTTAQTNNFQNVLNPNGNYEAGGASANPQTDLTANTLRFSSSFGGGASLGGRTLTLNGLMNANTGRVYFSGSAPGGLVVGATNELVIVTSPTTDPTGYNLASFEIAAPIADGPGGPGRLTKSGPGVLRLTSTNTFTGPLTVASGTVILSSSFVMGSTLGDTTPVEIAAGGTLSVQTVESFGALSGTGTLETSGLTRPNSDGSSSTFAGVITSPSGNADGAPALIKDGVGTLTLTNQSTYPQATFVDGGTLRLGTNNVLKPGNEVRFRLNGPASTLDLNGFAQTLGTVSFGPLAITAGGDAGGNGTGSITGSGPGSVLTVEKIRYEGNGGTIPGASISVNTLDLGGAVRSIVVNDSTAAAADLAVSSSIRNGGLLISGEGQYAGGVLLLSGASTYTGPTTVTSGTLKAGASTSVFGLGSAVTVSGISQSALLDLNGFNVTIGSLTLGAVNSNVTNQVQTGTGTLTLGGDVATVSSSGGGSTIAGNLALGATRTFTVVDSPDTASDLIVSAILSGSGAGLRKTGAGTLVLSGANTYSGPTTIGSAASTAAGGAVLVTGANGTLKNSPVTVTGAGQQLRLDYADFPAVDRFGDALPLTLALGGELRMLTGVTGLDTSETIGSLVLGQGAGTVTLELPSSNVATLTAGTFDRGANQGTALIRGSSLGSGTSGTTRLRFLNPAGLNLVGTGTATGATNLRIAPFLFGATKTTGTTSTGTNFLTYDNNGLRPLDTAEQTLVANGATGDNVKTVVGLNSVTGSRVYNSLLVGAGDTADSPASIGSFVNGNGGTLTLTSGALASVSMNRASGLGGFSSIVFGSSGANEAIITTTVPRSASLVINSPINTAAPGGGLTKAGAGTLVLGASNLYTGPTTINQGVLIIGSETTGDLGGNTAPIIVQRDALLIFGRTDAGLTISNVITGQGVSCNPMAR